MYAAWYLRRTFHFTNTKYKSLPVAYSWNIFPPYLRHRSSWARSLELHHRLSRSLTTVMASTSPSAQRIDFANSALPEYQNHYAVVISDVLSPAECDSLVLTAEASTVKGWELAQVNVGGGKQMTMTNVRNSSRIMLDDHDLADKLLSKVRPFLEDEIGTLDAKDKTLGMHILGGEAGLWKLERLNERLRFLKYHGGEYFKPHYDGQYITPDGSELSWVTFQLYLRSPHAEDNKEPLKGGSTRIFSYDMKRHIDVEAKPGSVFVFQHDILHSGEPVTSGVKIAVRTDFMYKKIPRP